MLHAACLALAPQTEREILSAIAALDWNADVVTEPLCIIQKVLGVPERQAIELFLSVQNRRMLVGRGAPGEQRCGNQQDCPACAGKVDSTGGGLDWPARPHDCAGDGSWYKRRECFAYGPDV